MLGARRNDTIVLGYHAVSDGWPSVLAVSVGDFERQISALLGRGYRGVTFHDAVHGEPVGRRFAVTFDDSYLSLLTNALPVLDRLGVPATVFVPTAYAGSEHPMRWDGIEEWSDGPYASELLPMSWEQLAQLRDAGWEIGSHTASHPHLPETGEEELEAELKDSKEACESHLGEPCRTLAYPYGEHDERVIEATRRAGYAAACTLTVRLHAASPLRWPRVGIFPADGDGWRFKTKVSPAARALRASRAWDALEALRRTVRRT
jgi:peptidoglycan/xylan/chitin deacetylase (PgdA/CDA1 family)